MLLLNWSRVYFVLFADQILGLVELPRVDDNNILTTEAAVRNTINTLFKKLGLRGVKTKPRLKEYATVHNHLVAFTLQDYTNLKEIAKLTRVDKTKINNETGSFIAVINELLKEDVVEEHTEAIIAEADDVSVINYIDEFLTTLDTLKEQYGATNKNFHIKDDVYQILKDDKIFFQNFTVDNSDNSDFEGNDTLIDESNFWKPDVSGRRIYRGKRTKIKHFPFVASIQIFNKFHCAGSIIKSDLVITASSCLQLAWNNRFFRENPAFLSVRIGSNFYNGGGENIPVLEVYFHPSYNPKTLWNNICILRLVMKIHFKKNVKKVKKIDFDKRPSHLPLTTDGITIVGWGARGGSSIVGNPWENVVSFAVLDVYPLRDCQDIYSRQYVTNKHFCAGFLSKGGGACNHDVGGPGVVNGILMGIISFGSPVCGTPNAPTVFTKVGYYADWIEEIMEQEVYSVDRATTLKPKFEFTLGQYYEPIKPTTFKIEPLPGKLIKPIPITEVDALRMLEDGELFQEFLNTVFGVNDAPQLEDHVRESKPRNDEIIEEKIREPVKLSVQVAEVTTTTAVHRSIEVPEDDISLPVTEIGIVEPNHEMTSTTSGDEPVYAKSFDSGFVRVHKNKNLEKDLVNLIGDIDLKELINNMPSVEDEKILDDDGKVVGSKISLNDDSLLTLLYLSEGEKAANNVNHNKKLVVPEFEDFDDGTDSEDDEESEGLSIPLDSFRDMTYRNSNQSGGLYDVPNNEMYYLISEAINDVQNGQ